jgi:outer membrane lipoprotein-sorting protein
MLETFKKIIIFLIILAFFGGGIAFAQESDVENQLQETQEDIDKLIKAKAIIYYKK